MSDLKDPTRYAPTATDTGCVMSPNRDGRWMQASEVGVLLVHLGVELTRLRERCEALEAAIELSGMDISPCLACREPVVCVPDGMPMCDKCGTKEPDHAD